MGSVYSMNPELYGNSTSCMYASGNILTGRVMDPTGSQPPGNQNWFTLQITKQVCKFSPFKMVL